MTWLIDAHENDPDPIHKDPRFENSTYLTYGSLNLLMVLKMVIRGLQVSNHRRQRHYFNNSDIYLLPPLS